MFLLAHPLHAHGPAGKRPREKRGIPARVVRGVVAVATGALRVDAAHAILRQVEHLGDRPTQRINALTVGPHRQRTVVEPGDGARRTDRSVHLIRSSIARFDRPRARRRIGRGTPVEIDDLVRRRLSQEFVQLGGLGKP